MWGFLAVGSRMRRSVPNSAADLFPRNHAVKSKEEVYDNMGWLQGARARRHDRTSDLKELTDCQSQYSQHETLLQKWPVYEKSAGLHAERWMKGWQVINKATFLCTVMYSAQL